VRHGRSCILSELAGVQALAVQRGLFCSEHLSILPRAMQERLAILRKGWRAGLLGRSISGGLPEPLWWEKEAHHRLFPEA
jgi:hypothetical protein